MPEEIQSTPPPPAPPAAQFTVPFGFNVANIPGLPTPFAFRPNCEEDKIIMSSIFGFQEYLLPIENFQPKLILDCGGNIGCAAVYFANKYPDAQIYSVEPAENNFQLLKFNTTFYKNVHVINSALWNKETFIKLENADGNNLAWMVFETMAKGNV